MAIFNVYTWRSKTSAAGGVIRIWRGEARSEQHAVVLAAQVRNLTPSARRKPLFAREAGADPYESDKRTIIEEPGNDA